MEKFSIGDRVVDTDTKSVGTVINVIEHRNLGIKVLFDNNTTDTYTKEGKYWSSDSLPRLRHLTKLEKALD